MVFARFIFAGLALLIVSGCSFSSTPESDLVVDSGEVSTEPVVPSPSSDVTIDEDVSVFDLPGASEQSWSPFFISDLAANTVQYGGVGQVLVFDEVLSGSSFNVVSGDSLEFSEALVYDNVSYSPALRIVSSGESAVEVVASDGVSVLFSFMVVS